MKIHRDKMSKTAFPGMLKMVGGLLISSPLLFAAAADAATWSGDSTTILRVRETTDDRLLIPLYEYLHFNSFQNVKNGAVSFHIGGWARGDLADNTTNENVNGDLQYGFLSYQLNKSNAQFSLGRQFITEGVAAEKVDGLYMRSDFLAGFQGSAFVGTPVTTEPNFKGGNLIYGGRIAHSMPKYYSVGLSYLKDDEEGTSLRQEEGVDLWLHPVQMVDVAGRSSYNSLTNGWMEHYYTASINPLDALRISLSVDKVKYRHYFHLVTTSALAFAPGLLNPGEEMLSLGGSVGYSVTKNLSVAGDYKHYHYDIAGSADYFGGGVTFQIPNNLTAGATFHRMDGSGSRLTYNEYHAYATKKLGRADFTLDFFDVDLDSTINGVGNTFSVAAVAGYDFPQNVRVAADIDYYKTIDMDNDLRGLIKVIYVFGSKGGQSEK